MARRAQQRRARRALRRRPCAASRSSASNGAIVITPRTRSPCSAAQRSASRAHVVAVEPALRLFADDVHLHQRVDRPARRHADARRPRRRAARCRANGGDRTERGAFTLFRCRCPMRCHRTGTVDGVHFRKRLLHPVFSDVAAARVPCGLHRVGAVRLRHRDDLSPPGRDRRVAPRHRFGHALPVAGPGGQETA